MALAHSSAPLDTSTTLPPATNPHFLIDHSPNVLEATHSHNTFDEPQTYNTSRGSSSDPHYHGYMYEFKLSALLAIRAKTRGYNQFKLATEHAAAEKFDDIVLQYTNPVENGQLLVQAKHRLNGTKKISYNDLVVVSDGDFSLPKYFVSYRNIKKSCQFRSSHVKKFIICTNIGFDDTVTLKLQNGIKLVEVPMQDLFQAPCYKLHVKRTSELYRKLKESSDLFILGTTLAKRIIENQRLTFETDVFRRYYKALKDNVFEIKKKGKAYVGVFHQKFIDKDPELTDSAKQLHDIILTNLKVESLSEVELKLSFRFGNKSKLKSKSVLPDEKEGVSDEDIHGFITNFILAVEQPNVVELDEKISKELGSTDQFNIQPVEFVANTFQKHIMDWAKKKEGIFLTNEDVKKICDSINTDLSVWTSRGTTLGSLS